MRILLAQLSDFPNEDAEPEEGCMNPESPTYNKKWSQERKPGFLFPCTS